ncbi:MAG: hypothetical protein ACK481_08000 [Candidatus Melainabacteria bacterium]
MLNIVMAFCLFLSNMSFMPNQGVQVGGTDIQGSSYSMGTQVEDPLSNLLAAVVELNSDSTTEESFQANQNDQYKETVSSSDSLSQINSVEKDLATENSVAYNGNENVYDEDVVAPAPVGCAPAIRRCAPVNRCCKPAKRCCHKRIKRCCKPAKRCCKPVKRCCKPVERQCQPKAHRCAPPMARKCQPSVAHRCAPAPESMYQSSSAYNSSAVDSMNQLDTEINNSDVASVQNVN